MSEIVDEIKKEIKARWPDSEIFIPPIFKDVQGFEAAAFLNTEHPWFVLIDTFNEKYISLTCCKSLRPEFYNALKKEESDSGPFYRYFVNTFQAFTIIADQKSSSGKYETYYYVGENNDRGEFFHLTIPEIVNEIAEQFGKN